MARAGQEELRAGLSAVAGGMPAPGVVTGTADVDGGVVFVFPGQGAQWVGMGAALLESSPVFAERLRECAAVLDELTGWSLLDVVCGVDGAPSTDQVDVVQPVLFALMVALAGLWRSYGVEPDAVVGHSQGEVAAAQVAGALSLDDAARIVVARSRAIARTLAGHGGMMSVEVSAGRAQELLAACDGTFEVAAVNGPSSVVVAGAAKALEELASRCAAEAIRTRRIAVDYASHTTQVEQIREELATALAGIAPGPGPDPVVLHRAGRLDRGHRSRRRILVPQPAAHGAVRAGDAAAAGAGPPGVRGGERAPRPGPGIQDTPTRTTARWW